MSKPEAKWAMRAVVQTVSSTSVIVDDATVGRIEKGLLVYLGVETTDSPIDCEYIAEKVRHLRIFHDADGKMNLDVHQASGSVLVVSAFTVQADARKGRRPTFDGAALGDTARGLYELFCEELARREMRVARGSFGALMKVHSVNVGPVCILLDSKREF